MNNSLELQKKSSAVSLSDMEIFVFPELMYSLVLANIMSPRIWKWLDDPWFKDIETYKPYKRIQRLRQYIMDNYDFNLDLDTWGLTTKEKELNRFKDFIDPEILSRSNALFGYEGDKYYFDIDIRRHFGLDKYNTDDIPYWKTETVEAMDAFCHKPQHNNGAGECVSLSSLWAAALFIICKIPLEDIFLMATPLHSQNFVIARDGIITNNRRIVTQNMWVNGTELSAKARRAMENEQVTIISHISGHVHVMYKDATINLDEFERFSNNLEQFLHFKLTPEILLNFLRYHSELQKCFQLKHEINGRDMYIGVERLFAYEHGSSYSIIGPSRKKLITEIDMEEFHSSAMPERIDLGSLEDFLKNNHLSLNNYLDVEKLRKHISCNCFNAHSVITNLVKFCVTIPNLPDIKQKEIKQYPKPLEINTTMDRNSIIKYLESMRQDNPLADYSFYAYRDLNKTNAEPFLKAAVERNPVAVNETKDMNLDNILQMLETFDNESIYDEDARLAQPDEVCNYKRGDGLEKAIMLANILKSRNVENITITISNNKVTFNSSAVNTDFVSEKNLKNSVWKI